MPPQSALFGSSPYLLCLPEVSFVSCSRFVHVLCRFDGPGPSEAQCGESMSPRLPTSFASSYTAFSFLSVDVYFRARFVSSVRCSSHSNLDASSGFKRPFGFAATSSSVVSVPARPSCKALSRFAKASFFSTTRFLKAIFQKSVFSKSFI